LVASLLKTEFTYYPLKNLENMNHIASLHIDSFKDILVNKLCAIADRTDVKDYADVYCAARDEPELLGQLFHAARDKCEISGIRHILQYRLLRIPEGIERLRLKTELSPADMEKMLIIMDSEEAAIPACRLMPDISHKGTEGTETG